MSTAAFFHFLEVWENTARARYERALRRRVRYRLRDEHLLRPYESAWTRIRYIDDDSGWMEVTSFTKAAVFRLFDLMAPYMVKAPEPVHLGGRPRRLDPLTQMVLTLYWLHSRGAYRDVAMHFGCPTPTVGRYIRRWIFAFEEYLPCFQESLVRWPNERQIERYAAMISRKYPGMSEQLGKQAFAFMDGCNFGLENQWDLTLQRNWYNPVTRSCKVGNLFVWAPDGLVIYQKMNCPGVMHDSAIASDVYHIIESDVPDKYAILADSAFPHLGGMILKPLTISEAVLASAAEQQVSRIVAGMRVPCEWGNRGLQAAFPRLHNLLPVEHLYRRALLKTVVHLSNFRTRVMDYGQIRAVYHKEYVRSGMARQGPNGLDRYLAAAMGRRQRRVA